MDLNSPHRDAKHCNRSVIPATRSSRPGRVAAAHDLHQQITDLIPRLTRYARVLTRDVVAADDLVQDCLARAPGKIHLWKHGTDLRAWLFTILHHQHISHTRRDARQRASTELQKCHPGLTLSPNQTLRLELRDLERALAKLPEEQRSMILLVGLEGMGYDEAASLANLPVGTVRSRVARGRESLRVMTELFPGRHFRRPGISANEGTRRPARNRDHFQSIPAERRSSPRTQEVLQ